MSATGGCACGAVKFEVTGKLRDVVFCHCSKCRRWHGHFGAYTRTRKDGFALKEQKGLKWHSINATCRRGFCQECGSVMFFDDDDSPDTLGITAGVLDDPTGLKPLAHIYLGSKGDYYGAPNDAPGYDADRPPLKPA
ncbi:MAG: GFA family protein [Myxococcaceae bacterium]